ncbi:hypothetical protein KA037_05395 [Patescibacteria group bacterium]|nr:hypothetical protein [Patescibacteria group bacterium]
MGGIFLLKAYKISCLYKTYLMRRLLLILFVLSLGFTSSTFAQNQCVTCGSPAKVFSDYTEFVNKVL